MSCDEVPTPASPTASDDCDTAPTISFTEARTDGNCPGNYTLTRTWTATDHCGNSSSQSQVITVTDTEAPVLADVPSDISVSCGEVPAPASPTASDDCDTAPTISFTETRTDGNCPGNYTLTRTWTATDHCGNSSSQTQVITVTDTEAPVLASVPSDISVSCDEVPAPASPTASDDCDTAPIITFNEVRTDGNCPGNYTLTRTWTATDHCGNSSSQAQVITVTDTEAPVLAGVPSEIAVSCDEVPAPASPTASDDCDGAPIITFNEERTDGNCPGNYTLTRTWTATDHCGNSSSQTQVITVTDTEAPVLVGVPSDVAVSCDEVPAPASPTASDDCDTNPTIVFNEERTDGNCPGNYTLTRTWTATDHCGNSSSAVQVITVTDTEAPVPC